VFTLVEVDCLPSRSSWGVEQRQEYPGQAWKRILTALAAAADRQNHGSLDPLAHG
jgi:hypothetical protein